MTYRLLFGQSRGSRSMAKAELKKLSDGDEEYDHLLDILCTRPYDSKISALPSSLWPVTCRNYENNLQEGSAYSAQDDFPMFGQRLAKLQDFSLRQQPHRLRDLWRDRRNPLQWYTFWAVLIFGGISIAIALLQLAVGVAQLVASVMLSSGCSCIDSK